MRILFAYDAQHYTAKDEENPQEVGSPGPCYRLSKLKPTLPAAATRGVAPVCAAQAVFRHAQDAKFSSLVLKKTHAATLMSQLINQKNKIEIR